MSSATESDSISARRHRAQFVELERPGRTGVPLVERIAVSEQQPVREPVIQLIITQIGNKSSEHSSTNGAHPHCRTHMMLAMSVEAIVLHASIPGPDCSRIGTAPSC